MNARVNAVQDVSEIALPTSEFLRQVWQAVGGEADYLANLRYTGVGKLHSVFALNALAEAVVGAAGLAAAQLLQERTGEKREVLVDRQLVSHWFDFTIRPDGWSLPPTWDAIAGDFQAADGWIRLHTNAPHHRQAAQAVLGAAAIDKESVAQLVSHWKIDELESAIIAQGGCAAAMRSIAQWTQHPQGQAVAKEALVLRTSTAAVQKPQWAVFKSPERPLSGIRVLDLTRVLAGPVATRFLAGFGADVLRIDPPDWDEPVLVPDVTLGKRLARLDLRTAEGRNTLEGLIRQADVMVHGYRADALERLGFGERVRRDLNPGLVDVCLDAYGWSGPWQTRRGFDSLLQMSTGIAEAGMRLWQRDRPTPLPVQALDHATGYIMAASAINGLLTRMRTGQGSLVKASLARTAAMLVSHPAQVPDQVPVADDRDVFSPEPEMTAWGKAHRVLPPVQIGDVMMKWERPAAPLGSSAPSW
jgi:crotonobetainyl-CoA:carnitine CoA-transferase CaiB-like acyl-CoA transferase